MKVYYCFPDGKSKALTMSYDDGRLEDERLVDIFNKYGIKATFNLNAGLCGNPKNKTIPKEKIHELYKGHEVATHTYTHPFIERCSLVEVAKEILKDREELEKLTGGLVRGHAYPYGSYNEEIKTLFKKLGIAYGRVVPSRPDFELPKDPLEWYSTCHHNDSKLMEYGQYFLDFNRKEYLKLMYVWGHSFEFTQRNNWEVIENFCKLMSGREDIWYATNIEIIDYMDVIKNLKFSGNGEAVFNPSVQSAWLQLNDTRIIEIRGGTYVHLVE